MTKGEIIENCFADRIRELIGENEPVTAFARRVGLNQAAIDRYIKGQREPNADALRTLSKSCNVSTDWLLGISDSPTGEFDSNWRTRAIKAEEKLDKVNKALAHALRGFEELREAVK